MNDNPESAFSDYIDIIKKRWWLFLLLPVITAVAILVISSVSEYEYVSTVRLQVLPSDTVLVPLFSRTPIVTADQQRQSVHDDFYDIVRDPAVAWQTIADLGLDMSASELISRIDTKHTTEFITVSARMPSAELAQKVAATHTQNAIDALRAIRVNPAKSTLDFLTKQIKEQAKALADARQALQKFQLEHEVSALPDEITAEQSAQRQLTADRDALRTEAAKARALAETYQQQAQDNRQAAADLQADLDEALANSAAAPIAASTTVTNAATATPEASDVDTAPAVTPEDAKASEEKIQSLRELAAAQEEKAQEQLALAAGYDAAIEDYNHILDEREQQIVFLLGLQDQYAELLNNVKVQQGSYDFLVDKSNEASLKVAQGNQGYLEVVSPAQLPHAPAPKHTWQLLIVGVLASLLLALFLAFILELIERGVSGGQN